MFFLAFILPLAFACPEVKDPQCGTEEMLCPGLPDPQGCPVAGACIPHFNTVKNSAGTPCANFCPVHCDSDHIPCPNPSVDGCPSPPDCMHNPKDAPCPFRCPLHCTGNDVLCPMGPDPKGCPLPDYCAPTCSAATSA